MVPPRVCLNRGHLLVPFWGESNMVILRDFPCFWCIVWIGNIITPVKACPSKYQLIVLVPLFLFQHSYGGWQPEVFLILMDEVCISHWYGTYTPENKHRTWTYMKILLRKGETSTNHQFLVPCLFWVYISTSGVSYISQGDCGISDTSTSTVGSRI